MVCNIEYKKDLETLSLSEFGERRITLRFQRMLKSDNFVDWGVGSTPLVGDSKVTTTHLLRWQAPRVSTHAAIFWTLEQMDKNSLCSKMLQQSGTNVFKH